MYRVRAQKELKQLSIEPPPPGIRLNVNEENIQHWKGEIDGPEGTAYHGYILRVNIKLGDNYPLASPTVNFDHPVYHPNIGTSGNICLDILQSQWAPTLSVKTVMLSLSSLLNDPKKDSPLNGNAAQNWKHDKKKYFEEAKNLCERHCKTTQIQSQ